VTLNLEEDGELFVVNWHRPVGDATSLVLCDYCGAERYSSPQNLRVVREKKMGILCLTCYGALSMEYEMRDGGSIRQGVIINAQP
jgi:hypothetical protein